MNSVNGSNAKHLFTEDYATYINEPSIDRDLKEAPEFAVLREINIKRKNKKVKFGIIIQVSLIFILGLLIVFRYASITELGYEVSGLQNKYKLLKTENARIEVNIAKQMNLSEISEIAINELGMQKPQSYQIVKVSVVPTDQTEVLNLKFTKDEIHTPWYNNLLNDIKAFLGICK